VLDIAGFMLFGYSPHTRTRHPDIFTLVNCLFVQFKPNANENDSHSNS